MMKAPVNKIIPFSNVDGPGTVSYTHLDVYKRQVGALSMNADSKSECDEGTCIDCGSCISACPVEAISQ